jgi:hypothetical protein
MIQGLLLKRSLKHPFPKENDRTSVQETRTCALAKTERWPSLQLKYLIANRPPAFPQEQENATNMTYNEFNKPGLHFELLKENSRQVSKTLSLGNS